MNVQRSSYGFLSVGLPLFGLGIEAASAFFLHFSESSRMGNILLLSVLATFLLGIGFGITSVMRKERLRWLPAIGIGLSLVLITMHFIT